MTTLDRPPLGRPGGAASSRRYGAPPEVRPGRDAQAKSREEPPVGGDRRSSSSARHGHIRAEAPGEPSTPPPVRPAACAEFLDRPPADRLLLGPALGARSWVACVRMDAVERERRGEVLRPPVSQQLAPEVVVLRQRERRVVADAGLGMPRRGSSRPNGSAGEVKRHVQPTAASGAGEAEVRPDRRAPSTTSSRRFRPRRDRAALEAAEHAARAGRGTRRRRRRGERCSGPSPSSRSSLRRVEMPALCSNRVSPRRASRERLDDGGGRVA